MRFIGHVALALTLLFGPMANLCFDGWAEVVRTIGLPLLARWLAIVVVDDDNYDDSDDDNDKDDNDNDDNDVTMIVTMVVMSMMMI